MNAASLPISLAPAVSAAPAAPTGSGSVCGSPAGPASPPVPGRWPVQISIPACQNLTGIDLDLTEACNLGCTYCFKWQKKAVHMDEATAKNGIDWLVESSGGYKGELKVNFMGGEPLLRFDLIRKIVPYGKMRARQRGQNMHFGCTTNCTVLTDEMMAFWRGFGMGFHCSIDGVPEVQNMSRPLLGGGASSDQVEKNVPKILAYRPEVMARATVTPFSAPFLCEGAKYFVRLGFTSMTFKPAVNVDWRPTDFEILRAQYEKLGELYLERITRGKPLNIDEFGKGLRSIHSTNVPSRAPCGAGRGLALIDPRGDIWPCHRFGPSQWYGQFRLGRLGGPFNDRLRDVFLSYDLLRDGRAGCSRCRAALTCRNWCYAECLDCRQSFYDPGVRFCEARRVLHDQIVHLYDELRSRSPDALRRMIGDTEARPGGAAP